MVVVDDGAGQIASREGAERRSAAAGNRADECKVLSGIELFTPVPPLATPTMPVTFPAVPALFALPLMLPIIMLENVLVPPIV